MNVNKIAGVLAALIALALLIGGCGGSGYGDTPEPTATGAVTARPTTEPTMATARPTTEFTPAATPRATTEPTPRAGPNATTEPTVAAAPSSTAAPPSSTAAPAPATRLTLVASSVRFAQPALSASAGIVTIEFDNRDEGIRHNVHFFRGADAYGTNIGSTEIQTGATQQTLALGELPAGAYFYQCDVHPSQMRGTLSVA